MAKATGMPTQTSPAPAGAEDASPKISRLVFNTATIQELDVFLLKRPMTMMFFLASDVVSNLFALRCTHGECAVAFLPLEDRNPYLVVDPA